METKEVINSIISNPNVTVSIPKNELKFKSARKGYPLNDSGLKDFVMDNMQRIQSTFNGNTMDILGIVPKTDEINQFFQEHIKEKSSRGAEDKTLQYFDDLLKIEFPQSNDRDRFKVFNTRTQELEEFFDLKKIREKFVRILGKEMGEQSFYAWESKSERICTPAFYQNKPKLIPVPPNLNTYKFNYYSTPEYRSVKNQNPTSKDVALISKYFKHLFPDPKQREYIFAWMYTSLASRQQTFLCLVGSHGVGKTLFMDMLTNLHGTRNTVRPKDPNAQFNYYLVSKSLVVYDEANISENTKEIFKRIANNIIQVERKGEDHKDIINSASICLATNYYHNLSIEPSDRRFSVPDLGTVKLEMAMGQMATSRLFELVEDKAFLHWFYSWLMSKFEGKESVSKHGKFSPTNPLKDSFSFESCCLVNSSDEIKFVLNKLKEVDGEGGALIKEFTPLQMLNLYKEDKKNNPSSRYKRVNKFSIFYKDQAFIDALEKYKINGESLAILKDPKTKTLVNNIDFPEEDAGRMDNIL